MSNVKRSGRFLGWLALGLSVLAVVLLFFQGCSGPDLESWHTENLEAEFNVDKASKIQSFDDYLRLENELFAQLEEQVYARTATGPEYALVRYSAGSAADPRQREPDWNRSFELSVESPAGGVLLLHGMSDSPYSLRALGETLQRRGYQVLGLRLPGHGTAPSGLLSVSWQDMAAAVRLAMQQLASRLGPKPIHMVGYSTGAPLALNFALEAEQDDAAPPPAPPDPAKDRRPAAPGPSPRRAHATPGGRRSNRDQRPYRQIGEVWCHCATVLCGRFVTDARRRPSVVHGRSGIGRGSHKPPIFLTTSRPRPWRARRDMPAR